MAGALLLATTAQRSRCSMFQRRLAPMQASRACRRPATAPAHCATPTTTTTTLTSPPPATRQISTRHQRRRHPQQSAVAAPLPLLPPQSRRRKRCMCASTSAATNCAQCRYRIMRPLRCYFRSLARTKTLCVARCAPRAAWRSTLLATAASLLQMRLTLMPA